MDYYLIGFFPKKRVTRSNWKSISDQNTDANFPAPYPVEQLCSVSNCIVDGLEVFEYQDISMNSFNQYGGFNQLNVAIDIIAKDGADAFDLYGFALPEFIFQDGLLQPEELGCVEPDDLGEDCPNLVKLGYDVVEIATCSFMCSPLTCNSEAWRNQNLVNQYCLIEHEADAIKLATEFSITKPEPGPYIIVEIWKYAGPKAAA